MLFELDCDVYFAFKTNHSIDKRMTAPGLEDNFGFLVHGLMFMIL